MPNIEPRRAHENRLLASLTDEDYQRVEPHLTKVSLRLGEILYQPDEHIEYVYFPFGATVSLINILRDGSTVEVGVVGPEGVVGTPIILANDTSPYQAIVQVADGAQRMRANILKHCLEESKALTNLMLRYTQALMIQVAQTAACNRMHNIEQRLARWLLQTHDRIRSDDLGLTQEFIATMLGTRRAGVTVAAGQLQLDGLINYKRSMIHIVDREGLEAKSCECYRVVVREYKRLIGGI